MKLLTNMQLAIDMVIVANGLALAAWIASKALLNVMKATRLWVLLEEQSDSQTSEDRFWNKVYYGKLDNDK